MLVECGGKVKNDEEGLGDERKSEEDWRRSSPSGRWLETWTPHHSTGGTPENPDSLKKRSPHDAQRKSKLHATWRRNTNYRTKCKPGICMTVVDENKQEP